VTGGAGIAALRLINSLNSSHYQCEYFNIERVPKAKVKRRLRLVNKLVIKAHRLYQFEGFSLPFGALTHSEFLGWDILHIHHFGSDLNLKDILKNIQIPIVITLHDRYWCFGGFHIKQDYIRNKNNVLGIFDKLLGLLKSCYVNSSNSRIVFVAPSQGVYNDIFAYNKYPNIEVYKNPNIIPSEIFNIMPKDVAREMLKIENRDKPICLMVVSHFDRINKGILLALEQLKKYKIRLLLVGKIDEQTKLFLISNGFDFIEKGKLSDTNEIAHCYSSSDFLLFPSFEENFPNVVIEAFLTGLPVLGFNVEGVLELLDDKNGVKIDTIDGPSLEKGLIEMLYKLKNNFFDAENIRKSLLERINNEHTLREYIRLYDKILEY